MKSKLERETPLGARWCDCTHTTPRSLTKLFYYFIHVFLLQFLLFGSHNLINLIKIIGFSLLFWWFIEWTPESSVVLFQNREGWSDGSASSTATTMVGVRSLNLQ